MNIKVYNNYAQNVQCECISKSTNERCNRRSTYNINGKNYCNQHSRYIIPDFEIKTETKKFKKPTLEEIESYCKERNNGINAEMFYDFYEANGWVQGKNKPIKDWKACVRTWEQKNKNNKQTKPKWMDKEIQAERSNVVITKEELEYLGINE